MPECVVGAYTMQPGERDKICINCTEELNYNCPGYGACME